MERKEFRLEVRRRAILEAAADEFARVGFERATLDDIGARVGLSKAGLYHYVEGKEQLLDDLFGEVSSAIELRAGEITSPQANSAERLRAFVTAHVHVGVTTPAGRVLAHHLELVLTSESSAQLRQRHQDALACILQDGIRMGEFRPLEIGPVVQMLFAALNSIPCWFDSAGPLTVDGLMDQTVGLFLAGIRKPGTETPIE